MAAVTSGETQQYLLDRLYEGDYMAYWHEVYNSQRVLFLFCYLIFS